MLQRLANPHIPYNPSVMWTNPQTSKVEPNPWYNPYVTIDYISNIPVWNSAVGTTGTKQPSITSVGKRQPYAGFMNPTFPRAAESAEIQPSPGCQTARS